MDIEIKDTPYSDRYCGNCLRCGRDESTKLLYCYTHKCYVASNKWCADWLMEYRKENLKVG